MQKFKKLKSLLTPLNLNDIDTDMIIPAQYLTLTGEVDYGKFLFSRLRENDPNFALNQEKYSDSEILLAGANFGCGSSREHAVWALLDYGFKVIIASSFADIFYSNSLKNGLVLVQLPNSEIQNLFYLSEKQELQLTINLETQKVDISDQKSLHFPFDPFRKECILKGLDDLDYILQYQPEIDSWQEKTGQFLQVLEAN